MSRLRIGAHPFLIVGGAVVFLLAVVLDDAAHGVDLERALFGADEQDQHGIDALLPQRGIMLVAVDGAEVEAADIVAARPPAPLRVTFFRSGSPICCP